MIKVLFLIHDLGQGGAEKVLINLVNNMDQDVFDITVIALFGGGVNEPFLNKNIKYKTVFQKMIPGNSIWMKVFSPKLLHRFCVKDHYDIEISYLEGPSARVISGCSDKDTRLVSWIHSETKNIKTASASFRSGKEAFSCYDRFHMTVGVSEFIRSDFMRVFPVHSDSCVLYNTVESDKIRCLADEACNYRPSNQHINLIGVGTLKEVKGFERLIRVIARLKADAIPVNLYLLGKGKQEEALKKLTEELHLESDVRFLGYDTNPYKHVKQADFFVCSSYSEGFSTAATEALIVGTPVFTTNVSGMTEMLGKNNEYGIIVDNDEDAIYQGLKKLLTSKDLLTVYKNKAIERGGYFSTSETVAKVQAMLESLMER